MITATPTIPQPTEKSADQPIHVEPPAPSGSEITGEIPAPTEGKQIEQINDTADSTDTLAKATDHEGMAPVLQSATEAGENTSAESAGCPAPAETATATADLAAASTAVTSPDTSTVAATEKAAAEDAVCARAEVTNSESGPQCSADAEAPAPVPNTSVIHPEFTVEPDSSEIAATGAVDNELQTQALSMGPADLAQPADEAVSSASLVHSAPGTIGGVAADVSSPPDGNSQVPEATQQAASPDEGVTAGSSTTKELSTEFDHAKTPEPQTPEAPEHEPDCPDPASDCESGPAGRILDESAEPRDALMHSSSAIGSKAAVAAEKPKKKRRKPKPSEFVKTPAPSTADAGALSNTASPPGPAIFEAQPRILKPADSSYNAPAQKSKTGPSLFEKPPAPSHADVSFHQEASVAQRKAVYSSHASPSMADMNYGSPQPNTSKTSLYVSPPKTSTADTGTYAAGINCASSVAKSVFESTARPSMAAVRACDPVPQTQGGPSVFASQPAEPKANARAGVEIRKSDVPQTYVFESAPKQLPVAAKWSDPVVPKSTNSIFESKAAPSRADAAADRSLDSGDEYETDTEDE